MTTRLEDAEQLEDAVNAFAAGVLNDEQLETIIHIYKELLNTIEQIDATHIRAGRPTEFGQHVVNGMRMMLHSAENMKFHRELGSSRQRPSSLAD